MKKRFLSALLCATMMASLVVGCGAKEEPAAEEPAATEEVAESETPEEPKEPVTIAYWYRNAVGEQEYTDQVEAKLNEILASTEGYEHITIDLHPCTREYKQEVSLAQASGEQMDLLSLAMLDLATEVGDGSVIPLDDLIAQSPETVAELPEWLLKMGVVDGQTYYVPNYQQATQNYYYVTPQAYLDAAGYTVEDFQKVFFKEDKTAEEVAALFEDYCLKVREGTGKETKWIDSVAETRLWIDCTNIELSLNWAGYYYTDLDTNELKFSYTKPEIMNAWNEQAELYDKGLVHPDAATIDREAFHNANWLNDEAFIGVFTHGVGSMEMLSKSLSDSFGFEVVAIPASERLYVPREWAAGGVGISSTSEHPEEAMAVMTLLFNSKYEEFYNTLCWGLEGTHYEKNADGTIKTLEFDGAQGGAETTYCYHKWTGGNTFNAWCNQSSSEELNDYILNEMNEGPNTIASPIAGAPISIAEFETEKAQIIAVLEEYGNTFLWGAAGVDGTEKLVNEYMNKMEAAGLSKMTESVNEQVKAFLDAK